MAWTLPHAHSSKDRRGVFVAYRRRLKQILQAYVLPLPSRTMSGLSLFTTGTSRGQDDAGRGSWSPGIGEILCSEFEQIDVA
jgi:hypothetical protein